MWLSTPDNSIVDGRGRFLFFSLPRFISEISRGNACFICGAKPDAVPFNDEHVLPDWILRRYKLHERFIYLPDGRKFRYGSFKIPCCSVCNAAMGEIFEEPISQIFAKGPAGVSEELRNNGPWRLFCWMSLIFVKAHLKDNCVSLH